MIALYLLLSCFVYYAKSSTTVIRMPRGTYRIPVEFIAVEGDETLPGFATFQVKSVIYETATRPLSFYFPPYYFPARGIRVGEGEERSSFYFDQPVMIRLNQDRSIVLPGGPQFPAAGSRSMECFRSSFLFSALSRAEDALIINPTNPREYAYEGQIFYTPIDSDWQFSYLHSWPIRTTARLTDASGTLPSLAGNGGSEFVRSALNFNLQESEGYVPVPSQLRVPLLARIISMGVQYNFGDETSGNILLEEMEPDRLGAFPSFEIMIPTEDGTQVHIALIPPSDYITPTETPGVYQIVFSLLVDRYVINHRILQNLLIHFDYTNNRIGFGEPLVEL